MSALDVLPLEKAKRYLNIPLAQTQHDDELEQDFIPPAVERVQRHLGRTLVDETSTSGSERLALKMVLGEYWRTQRVAAGRGRISGGGASGTAIEADSGPAGEAPLRVRLTDLLGEEAPDQHTSPRGTFPPACGWPDPAAVGTVVRR